MRKLKIMPFILGASIFALSSCTWYKPWTWFDKNDTPDTPETPDAEDQSKATGGGWEGNVLTLDFTDGYWKSNVIDEFISDKETLYSFEFLGVNYNDKGSFVSQYDDKKWLMLKNKLPEGKVEAGEKFAFIGNGSEYDDKTIKSVDVYVSSQTGGVNFVVDFSSSAAFTESSETGVKKQKVTAQTETTIHADATSGAKYWSVSATCDVDTYRKNGGVDKIVITFND